MLLRLLAILSVVFIACQPESKNLKDLPLKPQGTFVALLGIAQDAGYPQAGCNKKCCGAYWNGEAKAEKVISLGLIDPETNQKWLFEATPDFKLQLKALNKLSGAQNDTPPNGIFLTHAHTGHYTGLMHLGREAMGSTIVPVYAMPKMKTYLETNGPWEQLVALNNILLKPIKEDQPIQLTKEITVTPILVPHRDEYSETVGFIIASTQKKLLFIPDINKWDVWDRSINQYVEQVDYALLDAAFYDNEELPNRDMSAIPHPFVVESLQQFKGLSKKDKNKITFVHFNHSNPLLSKQNKQYREVVQQGYQVGFEGMQFPLIDLQ